MQRISAPSRASLRKSSEAQIVADGDAEAAHRGGNDQRAVAGAEKAILAHGRKEMELAVTADDLAVVDDPGGVIDVVALLFREAPHHHHL
jgi:hypothetical protein